MTQTPPEDPKLLTEEMQKDFQMLVDWLQGMSDRVGKGTAERVDGRSLGRCAKVMRALSNALMANQKKVAELELKNNALRLDLDLYQMAWPFKLNERVQISERSEFQGDWMGSEVYFAGAIIERDGSVNVSIKDADGSLTDGWDMDDLERWVEP